MPLSLLIIDQSCMIRSNAREEKKPISRRLKREYYRFVDGMIRSHSLQKFFRRIFFLICFTISVIFATLLYLEK